jgi:hypothetical protein
MHDKIQSFMGHRHDLLWQETVAEVRHFRSSRGSSSLGMIQKEILRLDELPKTTLELALTNPSKVPGGVRWIGQEPHPRDILIWDFIQTVTSGSRQCDLCIALYEAICDPSLWPTAANAQSTGLIGTPFMGEVIDKTL